VVGGSRGLTPDVRLRYQHTSLRSEATKEEEKMNKYMFAVLLSCSAVYADEFVTYPDGSTAWRNSSGFEYGRSGGASSFNRSGSGAVNPYSGEYYAPAGGGGYVGTRDGTYYAPAGPNGVIDTRTGQFINSH
jgi:hypothetical protein